MKEKQEMYDINNIQKCEESFKLSCSPHKDTQCVKTIKVSDIESFDVLCDNGWTVIQQRINGSLDFGQNWDSYSEGFGRFDSDFFLGLKKIHWLTKKEPHELYIYLESLNGTKTWAQYDNFEITDEYNGYRLINLGVFSENGTSNALMFHENQKFTTYDRDNDIMPGNCAKIYKGGWWYKNCMTINLNAEYVNNYGKNVIQIYWDDQMLVKQEKMLIRPNL
ncbi:ficolin-2-like [Drosophila innubila]|uniref:ficolin-2-like n=2 Tax=Drosophila innubila TaxID=198719 RepID=UPI00148DACE3|nr:ficolin-2-like [Drosophila innubila]